MYTTMIIEYSSFEIREDYHKCFHFVQITLTSGKAPMQVDGEPWEQMPAEISISQHNQATMLVCEGMGDDS